MGAESSGLTTLPVYPSNSMEEETAWTAKGLSAEERRARVAAMVERGVITPQQAAMVDFRDPPPHVLEHARRLSLAKTFDPGGRR
jgi:hypothetical protein